MKKELVITKDGSHTILLPEKKITYHSMFGSIQESKHVYIDAGLKYIAQNKQDTIRIFEMGLGTGLNVLLTVLWAQKNEIPIQYTVVENHPLNNEEAALLNFETVINNASKYLQQIHLSPWNTPINLSSFFQFTKHDILFQNYNSNESFDLIYYDAFDPSNQPELWTAEIFIKLKNMLLPQGALVTYSAKSEVRRNMINAGLTVEKLKGALGKREMLRAEIP